MKKLSIILVILLVVAMPLQARAQTRAMRIYPKLTFSGTKANCFVSVTGNASTNQLEVTMKLMYGTSCIASWSSEGTGYVTMNKTATVTTGRTYKLVVEVTENGVAMDPVYVTGTC